MEYLPIVDEKGNVIGSDNRQNVHMKGLLHPVIRVLVKLPDGKIVFQRRSATKEISPNEITFAATGHIQAGQTPLEGAQVEFKEECGISASLGDFIFLGTTLNLEAEVYGVAEVWGQPHRLLVYFYGLNFNGDIAEIIVFNHSLKLRTSMFSPII